MSTNEETELWKEYRDEQKKRRAERLPIRSAEIEALADRGFTVKALTDYQYRVNERLDLYPIHRRYHDIKTGKRGNYRNALGFCSNYRGFTK